MKFTMKEPNLKHDLLLYSQNPPHGRISNKKKFKRIYKYLSDTEKDSDNHVAEFLRLDVDRFKKLRDNPNSPVHKIVKFVKNHPFLFFSSVIAVSYIENGDIYGAHYVVGYNGHLKQINHKRSKKSCVVLINSEEKASWTIRRFHQYCKKPQDTVLIAKKLDPQNLGGLKAYLDESEIPRVSTHDNEVQVRMRQPAQESVGRYNNKPDGARKALVPQNFAPKFPTSTINDKYGQNNNARQEYSYETPRTAFFNNQHDDQLTSVPQRYNGTTSKTRSAPVSTTFDARQPNDGYEKPRQFAAVIDDKPDTNGTTRENPLFYRLNNEPQDISAIATVKQDVPIQPVAVETNAYETPRHFAATDRMDPLTAPVQITPTDVDVKPNQLQSKLESTTIQQPLSNRSNRDFDKEKTESMAINGYSFLNNYKPPPANTNLDEKTLPTVLNGDVTDAEFLGGLKALTTQIDNVNDKPCEVPVYTIVVAGSTGGGKSTLLNNIYCMQQNGTFDNALENKENNLLLPVRVEEGVNNKLHIFEYGMRDNANEEFSIGKSTTQRPKDYIVDYGDFKVRFVDTPGTNDTRGDEQDRTNVKFIQDHLTSLNEVHGILFVIKTDDSKLSPEFRRTLNMLLELLPRKALNNCCFVYTFSAITSHFTPGPARQAVQAFFNEFCEKHGLPELQLTDRNQYCVDNEAFRYIVIKLQGGALHDIEKYRTSWDKTAHNVNRLLEHIKTVDPVTQNEFKSVKLLNELGLIMRQKLKTQPATDQTKHIMATIANICLSGSAIFCRQKSDGAEPVSTKDMLDVAIKDSADDVVVLEVLQMLKQTLFKHDDDDA